jgi:putative phosphoribosyl transferase
VPNGVPAGIAVADALGVPLLGLDVHRRDDADPVVTVPDGLAGRTVLVVDDGVETGTAARLAAAALRQAGAARRVLAVPVCPREAAATLELLYDEVLAPVRPLGRRALSWHYETFDTRSAEEARALLAARDAASGGPAGPR